MDPIDQFFSDAKHLHKYIAAAVAIFIVIVFSTAGTFIIPPGHRGVLVTMGKVSPVFAPEGFGIKMPFVTTVIPVSVRQQTKSTQADCYSSDLQQVNVELKVLYRIPESSVVKIFQEYSGEPFDSLVSPRVAEAVKEVTALQSAEQIVKKREEIKTKAFSAARTKVGSLLVIEDIVIQNVSLSTAKAKFVQNKIEIEAQTAIIKAKGEAEAIRVRGKALQDSPGLVQLQIVEKWNGISPLVVGGAGGGANILLPISDSKHAK
jgi:prohibitin 2